MIIQRFIRKSMAKLQETGINWIMTPKIIKERANTLNHIGRTESKHNKMVKSYLENVSHDSSKKHKIQSNSPQESRIFVVLRVQTLTG